MAPASNIAWKDRPRGLPGICFVLWAGLACAQAQDARTGVERKVSEIARTTPPPTLDGRLDDAVWSQATVIEDLHQYDPVENGEPTETSRFYVLYDDDNLYVGARLLDSNPALGFVNRGNSGRTRIWGGYRHRPDGHEWIRYLQLFASWQEYRNASTGELETRNIWARPLRVENHRGDRFGFLLRGTREVLTIPFEISDGIVIPPGDYDFDSYRLELQLAGERTLAPRADINKGDFYDGTWLQVDAAVEWRPSSRWYFGTGTDGAPEPRCCRARSGPTYRCTYFLTVAAPTSAPKISPEPLAASP